jgi:hypothetical protein
MAFPQGRSRRRRRLVAAAALALTIAIMSQGAAEALEVASAPPVRPIDSPSAVSPTAAARNLLVNAHNAGDTAPTAARSRTAGASMLEIDVSWDGSQLLVAHSLLPAAIRPEAAALGSGWGRTRGFPSVLLDVKTHSPKALDALARFVILHHDRPISFSTPNLVSLNRLHAGAPHATTLLSLTTRAQVQRLLHGPRSIPWLTGVSAKDSLLTRQVVSALRSRGLHVQVYSVDSMARVDALAAWGATGVTTDNLAIMRTLAAPRIL